MDHEYSLLACALSDCSKDCKELVKFRYIFCSLNEYVLYKYAEAAWTGVRPEKLSSENVAKFRDSLGQIYAFYEGSINNVNDQYSIINPFRVFGKIITDAPLSVIQKIYTTKEGTYDILVLWSNAKEFDLLKPGEIVNVSITPDMFNTDDDPPLTLFIEANDFINKFNFRVKCLAELHELVSLDKNNKNNISLKKNTISKSRQKSKNTKTLKQPKISKKNINNSALPTIIQDEIIETPQDISAIRDDMALDAGINSPSGLSQHSHSMSESSMAFNDSSEKVLASKQESEQLLENNILPDNENDPEITALAELKAAQRELINYCKECRNEFLGIESRDLFKVLKASKYKSDKRKILMQIFIEAGIPSSKRGNPKNDPVRDERIKNIIDKLGEFPDDSIKTIIMRNCKTKNI